MNIGEQRVRHFKSCASHQPFWTVHQKPKEVAPFSTVNASFMRSAVSVSRGGGCLRHPPPVPPRLSGSFGGPACRRD